MVSLVNSHTNATRIGWHMWVIDLRFAHGLPPGWVAAHGHVSQGVLLPRLELFACRACAPGETDQNRGAGHPRSYGRSPLCGNQTAVTPNTNRKQAEYAAKQERKAVQEESHDASLVKVPFFFFFFFITLKPRVE